MCLYRTFVGQWQKVDDVHTVPGSCYIRCFLFVICLLRDMASTVDLVHKYLQPFWRLLRSANRNVRLHWRRHERGVSHMFKIDSFCSCYFHIFFRERTTMMSILAGLGIIIFPMAEFLSGQLFRVEIKD